MQYPLFDRFHTIRLVHISSLLILLHNSLTSFSPPPLSLPPHLSDIFDAMFMVKSSAGEVIIQQGTCIYPYMSRLGVSMSLTIYVT